VPIQIIQNVNQITILRTTIGNSPPSEPKPYKANFHYTGIFTYITGIEISIPVFSITIPQVSISIPALICYENLRIKDNFLTWLEFELKTAWNKTPLHALTTWAIGTDKKRDKFWDLWMRISKLPFYVTNKTSKINVFIQITIFCY